jgi:hypothetical protein
MGVGKYSPRDTQAITTAAPVAPVREVTAEVMPVEQKQVTDDASDDESSTLQRLEVAERTAYQRYIDTGASERAAQIWLLVCDQKRKLIAHQQKQASDVSETETKFMATCFEVINTLWTHLQAAPQLLGLLCEGLEADIIAAKIHDQPQRTIRQSVIELASIMRGTSLELLLPEHERSRKFDSD